MPRLTMVCAYRVVAVLMQSLADKLSKSVNNELTKMREKQAAVAAAKRKKELRAKFGRATLKIKAVGWLVCLAG